MYKADMNKLIVEAKYNLLKKRDFKAAYKRLKYLADRDVYEGVFWCAFILEQGWLDNHVDLDRAQFYFEKMRNEWQLAEGSLGCARIILARKEYENRKQAVDYCFESMGGRLSSRIAYVLVGRILEELTRPPNYKMARKYYLIGASKGSHWAIKKYARSFWKSGNRIRSVLAHMAAFILWPFYLLIFGKKSLRDD